jgi:hypothetical protein
LANSKSRLLLTSLIVITLQVTVMSSIYEIFRSAQDMFEHLI